MKISAHVLVVASLVIVLGCRGGASGDSDKLSAAEKTKALLTLNVWLVDNLPDNAEPEENVKRALEVATDPTMGPAVGALQTIANKIKSCRMSTSELEALQFVAPLNVASGRRRLEKVLRHYTKKFINRECFKQLQTDFVQLSAELDQNVVGPITTRFAQTGAEFYRPTMEDEHDFLGYLTTVDPRVTMRAPIERFLRAIPGDIKKLAEGKNDPRVVFVKRVENEKSGKLEDLISRKNFEYALEKYLQQPCRYYTQHMGELFEKYSQVSRLASEIPNTSKFFIYNFLGDFRDGLLTFKRCRVVLSMSARSRKDIVEQEAFKYHI